MARKPNAAPPPVLPNGHDTTGTENDGTDIEVIEGDGTGTEAAEKQAIDPGVEALQRQLDEQKRRADAAEAERDRERAERNKDSQVIADSRLLVIDSTIATNESKKADIMRRMKEAKEAGDYDAETTAAAELAEVTLDLKQAKLGKDRLEQQIEQAKNQPESSGDRFEDWARENNIHPKSKDWLRGHMDYLTDDVKNAELLLAHKKAVRDGVPLNTPAYFEAIETNLGLRGAPSEQEEEVEERQTSAPTAPVSRSATPMGGRRVTDVAGITDLGNGKYRVSKEVAEAAQIAGVTVKEYVAEAMKLKRGSDGQLH